MVFSSLEFLCVFLPVVFLLAAVIRKTSIQNVLLVLASLVFYAYGEPIYVLLMIGTSVFVYLMGLFVDSAQGSAKKILCVVAVVVCLASLALFKYAGWFVDTLNSALSALGFGDATIPSPNLSLPIGISFYTFQALSYIVDVYRGDVPAQKNIIRVLLYISFFPQLIAGPIIRYHDVDSQLSNRSITISGVQTGLKRFIIGLAKKVLVADVMAKCADAAFGANMADLNAPFAWVGAIAYLLQIYFDFSAYSDMAIGMARMFGFTYKENFNYPYISTSVKEFWRRWHISLSTWLREYLYIPLGGNRKGRPRTVVNKMLVFLCCGLWHGAAWTFVVWGAIHGLFLLLEEYLPIHKLPKPIGWLYTILVVALAFVVFRADTLTQAVQYIIQMFSAWSFTSAGWVIFIEQMTPLFLFSLAIGIITAAPILPAVKNKVSELSLVNQKRADVLGSVVCAALLVICILSLAGGAYSPFIYFRF